MSARVLIPIYLKVFTLKSMVRGVLQFEISLSLD